MLVLACFYLTDWNKKKCVTPFSHKSQISHLADKKGKQVKGSSFSCRRSPLKYKDVAQDRM